MKKLFRIAALVVFLFQIGYMSYRIPQIIITESDFPKEIKLSAVVAGLCLGILYFLKDYSSHIKKPAEEDENED
ncbi:MAG: hypothetical protein HN580_08265 [Deltaproteobacteria bacterium]|jgi:hypothetical protein|nr:hypothetical protein [Deltaproteobacteria bacterium]MBT4266115.1 hypothetical protein [Deltaproteobacteria bacterium]MBT4642879.1 hypothetical protein [Deltaproteobacteria bacterium]MBT6504418.1 hypothetical protein [Deltaproteobacteria bacterium]MBT6615472.1 hypothetical protein [Deltaproteobacteria bacterium]